MELHPQDFTNRNSVLPSSQKPKSNLSNWKQWTLIALALLGFAVYLVDLIPDRSTEIFSQMALRLAIVLATVWLAFPQLEQLFQSVSLSIVIIGLLAAFVIARNPIILLSIVILCIVIAVIKFAVRTFNEG